MIHAVPHLADPYEAGRVAVRNSELAGAGEGVFALRDLPADTVACFYHGLYLQPEETSPASNQVREHPNPPRFAATGVCTDLLGLPDLH